jgi:hypothetical protein
MKIPPVIVHTYMTDIKDMFRECFEQDIVHTVSHEEGFTVVTFVDTPSTPIIEAFLKNIAGQVIWFNGLKYVITPQHLDV